MADVLKFPLEERLVEGVDLECIRKFVNALAPHQVDGAAMDAWNRAQTARLVGRATGIARNMYIVACCASRIADEQLWLAPTRSLL